MLVDTVKENLEIVKCKLGQLNQLAKDDLLAAGFQNITEEFA